MRYVVCTFTRYSCHRWAVDEEDEYDEEEYDDEYDAEEEEWKTRKRMRTRPVEFRSS
jgi:hypothetical protein